MKTLAAVLALIAATPAAAEPCQWGTNRPAIDVVKTNRIDENAPQMRCTQTTTERVVDGQVQTTRTWNFSIARRADEAYTQHSGADEQR